jgi:hypothetical protein
MPRPAHNLRTGFCASVNNDSSGGIQRYNI